MDEESKKPHSDPLFSSLRIFWGHLRQRDRNAGENNRLKILKKIPFFENLKRHELAVVAQIMHERQYRESEYVFETGQPGAALFIVQTGEVVIEINSDAEESTVLATLGKNAFFGELALLDESPRSASARTTVASGVLALFRSDLDQLMQDEPRIAAQIYKSLAAIVGLRLKATNELFERRSKKVNAA